jgi:hypothetical protein
VTASNTSNESIERNSRKEETSAAQVSTCNLSSREIKQKSKDKNNGL